MNLQEYERIIPNVVVDGINFYVPNLHCEWRIKTIYTKEPDTVAWLRGMNRDDVLFDVGANIGLYTMLAWKQGCRVFAFEPEAQNFAVLNRTIAMNGVGKDRVVAYPFCCSDGTFVDTLRLSQMVAGGSCHSFASDCNYKREEKKWAFEQGSAGFSIDSLVLDHGFPLPDHIKIDVDGFEDKVLGGARHVIAHCKSILVEMDSNNADHMGWKDELERIGFTTDESQIIAARRTEGPFTGIGNIIFTRKVAAPKEVSPPDEVHSQLGENPLPDAGSGGQSPAQTTAV